MEAEIRASLTARSGMRPNSLLGSLGSQSASLPLRTFLSNMGPVAARDPKVFLEAVANTCKLEAPTGLSSRQMVSLKKPQEEAPQQGGGGEAKNK